MNKLFISWHSGHYRHLTIAPRFDPNMVNTPGSIASECRWASEL